VGRLRDAYDILTGRAVKARPAPAMAGWGWSAGTGVRFMPPGSQFDYQREVGDLRRNSVVSICVQWLTRQILQAEWAVGTKNAEGEWEEAEGHPAKPLLEKCNPFWPGRQTWQGIIGDYVVYGNAYLYKNRQANGGGLPIELHWLPAHQVKVKSDTNPDGPSPIAYYEFDGGIGSRATYGPKDVIHFRDCPDPDNPLVGIGKVQFQIRNAAAMNAGERYQSSILRNPAVGKIISPKVSVENVMRGEVMDEAAMRGVAAGVRKALGGEGAGGIHATNMPIELLEANPSPEDMLLDRILDRPEAMIVAALGLNSMVLGLPSSRDTKTYANLAEARRDAWQHGVVPIQDDLAAAITNQLLADFGDPSMECWFDNDDVEAMKEDADARASRAQGLFQVTLGTRNECRKVAGMEPLEDGNADGDRYYGESTETQMQQAADSMAMQQQAMGDMGDGADMGDGGEGEAGDAEATAGVAPEIDQ
jgi:HK97 family phage portal protein